MLELTGLTTRYGDLTAVDDLSLRVSEGELFCLLGPSGCGKSTLLRTVGGLEHPTTGQVRIGGREVAEAPPNRRDCSIVFQDWALFPNKSVLGNVAFGLKMQGVGRAERRERAKEALELVEIPEYADSDPGQLSGGQKQRVALARSLTVDPDLLLLDEPLSNLDRRLRETMQLEIKEIQDRLGTTMLYVTHDQDEAFTLADRLGVMNNGRLVQVGEPEAVYDDPTNRFVESFLGSTNFLSCAVARTGEGVVLDTPLGPEIPVPLDGTELTRGDAVTMSLRPERLTVALAVGDGGSTGAGTGAGTVTVTGTVTETIHRGSDVRVRLSAGDADLFVRQPVSAGLSVTDGDTVALEFEPEQARYFDTTGERCR